MKDIDTENCKQCRERLMMRRLRRENEGECVLLMMGIEIEPNRLRWNDFFFYFARV